MMPHVRRVPPTLLAGALLALLALAGCGASTPTEVTGAPPRRLQAAVGQRLALRLQTTGPGEYRMPPAISSAAVTFRGAELGTPAVPAGVTQLVQLEAVAPGRAIVRFEHSVGAALVDTIDVQ